MAEKGTYFNSVRELQHINLQQQQLY